MSSLGIPNIIDGMKSTKVWVMLIEIMKIVSWFRLKVFRRIAVFIRISVAIRFI